MEPPGSENGTLHKDQPSRDGISRSRTTRRTSGSRGYAVREVRSARRSVNASADLAIIFKLRWPRLQGRRSRGSARNPMRGRCAARQIIRETAETTLDEPASSRSITYARFASSFPFKNTKHCYPSRCETIVGNRRYCRIARHYLLTAKPAAEGHSDGCNSSNQIGNHQVVR